MCTICARQWYKNFMIPLSARAVARAAPALVLAAVLVAAGAVGADAAPNPLAVSALGFAQASVDSSAGVVGDDLGWTVTDANPKATAVYGDVTIRMIDRDTGAPLGYSYVEPYAYSDGSTPGTPQRSSYTYTFPVPQYANTASTTWAVTQLTVRDDQGAALTLSGSRLAAYHATVATTAAVDTTGPGIDAIDLDGPASPVRPYAYVNGASATVRYRFTVEDGESGFWKGSLKLAGPAGQGVVTPFAFTNDPDSTNTRCGDVYDSDSRYVQCVIPVTLPAGAASGAWHLAAISAENNAGLRTTVRNPDAPSITVTSNEVVSATGFTMSPNPVDNWRDTVVGHLTMAVTGARDGIAAVTVDLAEDAGSGGCVQWSTPPVVNADGTVSVEIRVYQSVTRCRVTGIAITDGAGDVALYGSEYGAPDPAVTITRTADTTPPVATAAALSPATLPAGKEGSTWVALTVQAQVGTAPIDEISIYLYDSTGAVVGQSSGGVSQADDGSVTEYLPLPGYPGGLPAGAYTVGFTLTDAGGLSSYYGEPDRSGSQPVPGGPLVFTVTDN